MSLVNLQKRICTLIAAAQKATPGGYFAGGAALQNSLHGNRISEDIDRFHDSNAEVESAFLRDNDAMIASGLSVRVLRKDPSFIQATITDEVGISTRVDWAKDSAYRFFPLEASSTFGRILSPFDLATNKTLAMVGRLEARDWIDMMLCHDRLQRLGLLAFAACGKDPGYSPSAIIELGARFNRFAVEELAEVQFRSKPPDRAALHRKWHAMINEARLFMEILPPPEAGQCVMMNDAPFQGSPDEYRTALDAGLITFRPGRLESVVGVPQPAMVYPGPPDFDPEP